jgi:hypothetical protein
MLLPRWFLSLNGVGLLLMGGAMLVMRLRAGVTLRSTGKLVGLVWSLLCCTAGVALLLMAAGRLNQPGAPAPPKLRTEPAFPTDR